MNQRIALDASTKRYFDSNGFLHVESSHISKACVNPYYGSEIPGGKELGLDHERIYFGLRDPEELAKAAPTFNGLPLLLSHAVVTPENPQKEQQVGSVGTVATWQDPYLDNSLIITDAIGIDAVESKKAKELSAAYSFDADFTSGSFEGQDYDFVMRNICGNHVALVEEGRAGPDVSVADEKPINLRGKKMSKMKKAVRWALRIMAQDADPAIEQAEIEAAKEILAVNKVEAEQEGLDPKEIGLDEDKNAKIQKILSMFPELDETKAKELVDALQELAYEQDEAEDNTDETEPAMDEEGVKAALDKCGMDAENEEFQKAFAEGVKYGEEKEKGEPAKLDSEHESEGEKKAMDAAIKIARKAPSLAADAAISHMRSLNNAARSVRPLVGDIVDPLAFDSAEAIYGKALDLAGIKKGEYPRSSWRGMCDVLIKQRIGSNFAPAPLAQDAKTDPIAAQLGRIRVEG